MTLRGDCPTPPSMRPARFVHSLNSQPIRKSPCIRPSVMVHYNTRRAHHPGHPAGPVDAVEVTTPQGGKTMTVRKTTMLIGLIGALLCGAGLSGCSGPSVSVRLQMDSPSVALTAPAQAA